MAKIFKKRSKADIAETRPFLSRKHVTKAGKRQINGTVVVYNDGDTDVLLNPAGKGAKYAEEMHTGERMTNAGVKKTNPDGSPMKLTKEGKAYRGGYMDALKDAAKAYKSREAKKLLREQEKAARKQQREQKKAERGAAKLAVK